MWWTLPALWYYNAVVVPAMATVIPPLIAWTCVTWAVGSWMWFATLTLPWTLFPLGLW